MSQSPYIITTITKEIHSYNPEYGDDKLCECGHTYDRHFDSYDDMSPVGCKYCGCCEFVENTGQINDRNENLLKELNNIAPWWNIDYSDRNYVSCINHDETIIFSYYDYGDISCEFKLESNGMVVVSDDFDNILDAYISLKSKVKSQVDKLTAIYNTL